MKINANQTSESRLSPALAAYLPDDLVEEVLLIPEISPLARAGAPFIKIGRSVQIPTILSSCSPPPPDSRQEGIC